LQKKLDVQDNLDAQMAELLEQKAKEQDKKIIEREQVLKEAARMKELKTLKELCDKDVANLQKELAQRQNQDVEVAVLEAVESTHRSSELGKASHEALPGQVKAAVYIEIRA